MQEFKNIHLGAPFDSPRDIEVRKLAEEYVRVQDAWDDCHFTGPPGKDGLRQPATPAELARAVTHAEQLKKELLSRLHRPESEKESCRRQLHSYIQNIRENSNRRNSN